MAFRGVSQSRGINDPALDVLAHPGGDRLELASEKCRDGDVTLVGGVAPTALRFTRYLRRAHRAYPKKLLADAHYGAGQRAGHQHALRPGVMGRLVVSTPILPRYRIGDLIPACRPPYLRCIGRDQWWPPPRYAWDEFMTLNLGQL